MGAYRPFLHNAPPRSFATSGLSRRSFLRAIGALTATAGLAACGPRRVGPGPHGSETVQLVYQDWQTDWFPGLAQRMLDQFHARHPNIRVFYTPDPNDLNERMLADFQAGTAPDVLSGCCEFFPVWAQKGISSTCARMLTPTSIGPLWMIGIVRNITRSSPRMALNSPCRSITARSPYITTKTGSTKPACPIPTAVGIMPTISRP